MTASSLQAIPASTSFAGEPEVESINPLAGDEWDHLVTARSDHSIFHRSAWARVLNESYGHQPCYLKVGKSHPLLLALMEVRSPVTGTRGVSLPFSDFAEPLFGRSDQTELFCKSIPSVASERKWKHLEIRGGLEPSLEMPSFRQYESHELDLRPGIEALESSLPSSTRRAIRKAEKSALSLSIANNPEGLRAFYDLHSRTRRRHGLPPQPRSFFDAIGRHLIGQGLGELVLAFLGKVAVAGAIFLHSGGRAIYKFGASETRYWNLRPNQLVMWAGIRRLVSLGCKSLHFGRTSPGDEGLKRFKRSWGCDSRPLHYFRYNTTDSTWLSNGGPPSESHPLIFGHLPLALNRLAGRLIYPHLD